MKTRLCAILLVLTLLCGVPVLASCGENNNGTVTTAAAGSTESPTPESTRVYPTLTPEDYQKYEFHVLRYDTETKNGWSGYPNDIWVESTNGESLNDAVYKRNMNLESKFNITVTVENSASIATPVQNAVTTGDDPYDLIIQQVNSMTLLVERNLVYDLASDLTLNLDYPWWDENSVTAFTLGGKLYGVVSDITYTDKLSSVVTFYNMNVAEDKQIGDLYKLALDGDWTLEKMLEYAELMNVDVNQDGKRDGEDSYGISCQNDGIYYFLHGAGRTFVSMQNGDTLINNTMNEDTSTVMQRIFDIMADDTIYFNRQTFGFDMAKIAQMFDDDRALFLVRPLQTLYALRDYDTPFGLIPVPKYNADQESYYSSCNTYSAGLCCVMNTAKDLDRTSAILEVWAAESYHEVMPIFYDEVLDYKLNDDPQAAKVLDIVFANRVYDIGIVWNFGSIRSTFVRANLSSVSVTAKMLESAVNKSFRTFLDTLG